MQEIGCDDGSDSGDGEEEVSEADDDDELFEWDDEEGCYEQKYDRGVGRARRCARRKQPLSRLGCSAVSATCIALPPTRRDQTSIVT